MIDLTGKIAVITGASGGIGSAIAQTFSAQGAFVVLSGTRETALAETARQLTGPYAIKSCNLSQHQTLDPFIQEIEQEHGPIDILVNNAGVTRDQLLMRMKDEDWQTVLDVNLTAVFYLCRAAVKHMIKRRRGRIINISSIVGTTGNAGQTNYAATKAGLEGFSRCLAQEVASRHITINCIAPGFIATEMTNKLTEAHKEKLLTTIPLGRMGEPNDIASSAAFLASDAASYITGQTLHINGGMYMA